MLTRRVIINKKKQLATFAATLVVVLAVFFAILNYFLAMQRPPTSTTELTVGDLRYSLEMPRTHFRDGEDVTVRLTVKNIGKYETRLQFSHELEYDLVVQKDLNLIFATVPLSIWMYSGSTRNLPKPHAVVLKPQESRHYEAHWPQVDSRGDKVTPGKYTLTGVLNIQGQRQSLQLRGNR